MESAYGGSAEENNFNISINTDMILGFSMTGESIPEGSGLLTSIAFSNYFGGDICFGSNLEDNAIVNTNRSEFKMYMSRTNQKVGQQDTIRNVCREINNLKKELREIKDLIREVVNK